MSVENNIPNGWVVTTLGEVCDILSSKRIFAKEYKTKGIPFFRGKEITEKFKGNEISTELFISEEKYYEIKEQYGVPKEDDILLTSVGTLGNPYLVEANLKFYFKDGNLTWFRNFKNAESKFIYYWIISPQGKENLGHAKIGSTQQAFTMTLLKNVEISLPPLPEQKAIANILTAFDDKIENLQAQNKTLEQTAQTIFAAWFGKYQVGDELPEGWRVGKLGEIVTKISKGTTPRKKDLEGLSVEVPFLKVKDVSKEGLIKKDNLELIPKQVHENQLKRSILKTDDILFSIAGTIGRVTLVDEELNQSNCNQALAFIRLSDKNHFKEYVHLWLKSKEVQDQINNSIVQGVQANVSLTVLGDLSLTIPSDTKMNEWKEFVKPIYSKFDNNNSQIQTLKKTRDTLLPKLMSGALRVDEFKK